MVVIYTFDNVSLTNSWQAQYCRNTGQALIIFLQRANIWPLFYCVKITTTPVFTCLDRPSAPKRIKRCQSRQSHEGVAWCHAVHAKRTGRVVRVFRNAHQPVGVFAHKDFRPNTQSVGNDVCDSFTPSW